MTFVTTCINFLVVPTVPFLFLFFFFNDTATTEIYTLSLHDALPIWACPRRGRSRRPRPTCRGTGPDRKSTRLNSSHEWISYAVFCLKKKNETRMRKDQSTNSRLNQRKALHPRQT